MSSAASRRVFYSITAAVLAVVVICVFGEPSHMPFGYAGVVWFGLAVGALAMYVWGKVD